MGTRITRKKGGKNYNINANGFSLLDNLNSKKFMQNSRLVRLVKRKKKRKEKEEKWLTMISPDVGLYSQQKGGGSGKTVSRINGFNINNIKNNITSNNVGVGVKNTNPN